jgi:hypothetical protein
MPKNRKEIEYRITYYRFIAISHYTDRTNRMTWGTYEKRP